MKFFMLATALCASLFATPITVAAAPSFSVPVTGTGRGVSLTGTFAIQRFVSTTDGVAAVGTLSGTVVNAGRATTVVQTIALPVQIGQATCDILHLDIGPIALDLLGLQVDVSQIVVDITAQSGAGNLLGNLLCAVAGLLDDPGGLVELVRLLNQILALL